MHPPNKGACATKAHQFFHHLRRSHRFKFTVVSISFLSYRQQKILPANSCLMCDFPIEISTESGFVCGTRAGERVLATLWVVENPTSNCSSLGSCNAIYSLYYICFLSRFAIIFTLAHAIGIFRLFDLTRALSLSLYLPFLVGRRERCWSKQSGIALLAVRVCDDWRKEKNAESEIGFKAGVLFHLHWCTQSLSLDLDHFIRANLARYSMFAGCCSHQIASCGSNNNSPFRTNKF